MGPSIGRGRAGLGGTRVALFALVVAGVVGLWVGGALSQGSSGGKADSTTSVHSETTIIAQAIPSVAILGGNLHAADANESMSIGPCTTTAPPSSKDGLAFSNGGTYPLSISSLTLTYNDVVVRLSNINCTLPPGGATIFLPITFSGIQGVVLGHPRATVGGQYIVYVRFSSGDSAQFEGRFV